MVPLASLWLPIILSAVVVFIASSVIHMVLKYHHNDVRPVPNEKAVMDALRPFNIPPGDYMLPRCDDMKEMATPEFQEKLKQGPVAVITVLPSGPFNMGATLAKWFVYCLAMSVLAAYVAGAALDPGAGYLEVFRFAGTTAFIGYTAALWQDSIWWNRQYSTTIKSTFDGLVFGMLTAGVFGWLWP